MSYNPDQPRDKNGEWSSGASGQGGGSHPTGDKTSDQTLFHGTSQEFTTFDPGKVGSSMDPGFYGAGLSLTPSEGRASGYADFAAKNSGKQPVIYKAETNFEKPLHTQSGAFAFMDAVESALGKSVSGTPAEVTKVLRQAGFDSVIVHRPDSTIFEVTALDPSKVKLTRVK